MKKRILSLLLCCVMLAGLLPTVALAEGTDEQFDLTPGGTYWFDLSGENIPGPVNVGNRYKEDPVPDTTLHYVPFTYAGTVDAYVLNSSSGGQMKAAEEASQTTDKNAQYGYTYPHSLFVSDYVLTHSTVSWTKLNTESLIFGRSYISGGVDYTMRAPSAGSIDTGSGDSKRGIPLNNEWDAVLNKDSGYIKYWEGVYTWGQDTKSDYVNGRARRGHSTVRYWFSGTAYNPSLYDGFRPVLEVLNPDILGSDGLKAVTLDLNGGSLGGSTENIQIIVKKGATFTAPASEGLTRPDGDTGSAFFWKASDGKLYAPGASVPADVTLLTAQWTSSTDPDTYTVSFNSQGGSVVDSQNVKSGETATEPTTIPTRAGFDFGGWYTNADCTTKYDFSTPVTGNLILYAKWTLNTYTVTINAGENMSLSSGSANQSGLSGAMTATVYTAADGYYFPTDYAVEEVNGISVTRNSYTQITVSGTPTANTAITLAPATARTKEDIPTATFDAQGPDFGNLNGISQGIKYSLDGGITWTEHTSSDTNKAISGVSADKDIKVCMSASDSTKLDSDIQTIDVTKSATPTGVIGVACTTSENNNGKLRNVTTEMQYKKSDADDSSWTDCGGTEVTGLSNGTYYVRVKATGTVLASDYVEVTVAEYTAPSHIHSWAEDWSKNDTHHWHECTAEDCDVTDNAGKQGYGAHSFTAEKAEEQYLKSEATCTAKAVYYKSCADCGLTSKDTDYEATFESGELNIDNHTDTTEWIQTATMHTQKYKCCDKIVVAEEKHEWENGVCAECEYVCQHSGGEATCKEGAECEACGEIYGEPNPENHSGNLVWITDETQHEKKWDCCGETVISPEDHTFVDGKCEICDYIAGHTHSLTKVEAKPATATENGNKEYYICGGCDKWFEDENGTTEITDKSSVTVPATGSTEDPTDPADPSDDDDTGCPFLRWLRDAFRNFLRWLKDVSATITVWFRGVFDNITAALK